MAMTRQPSRQSVAQQHAVLLPGSLLPYRDQWQPYVETLPAQTVLIVEPVQDTPLHRALDLVATQLLAAGCPVQRLTADRLGPRSGIQAALPLV